MRIVLDSNIFFSALIKDSTIRKIILMYDDLFLFPSYIFEEMEKHKGEILRKSNMPKDDFDSLLRLLLQSVLIVPYQTLEPYKEIALNLVKDIDKDDALFIACALAYENSILWSDDKKLKVQKKVRIVNTAEMLLLMKIDS